jgi:hypothetical protein
MIGSVPRQGGMLWGSRREDAVGHRRGIASSRDGSITTARKSLWRCAGNATLTVSGHGGQTEGTRGRLQFKGGDGGTDKGEAAPRRNGAAPVNRIEVAG